MSIYPAQRDKQCQRRADVRMCPLQCYWPSQRLFPWRVVTLQQDGINTSPSPNLISQVINYFTKKSLFGAISWQRKTDLILFSLLIMTNVALPTDHMLRQRLDTRLYCLIIIAFRNMMNCNGQFTYGYSVLYWSNHSSRSHCK